MSGSDGLNPVGGQNVYLEEKSSYATQREQEGIARRKAREEREKQMFFKLVKQVEQGVKLSAEARAWLDQKTLEDPEYMKRLNVRDLAKKSLSSDNWAGELMKGSSAKFAAVAKTSVEDQLQKDMVGLVSYDELRKKKEAAAERLEAAEAAAQAAAAAEKDPEKRRKKRKREKGQGALSFDAEEEGQEDEEGNRDGEGS